MNSRQMDEYMMDGWIMNRKMNGGWKKRKDGSTVCGWMMHRCMGSRWKMDR